MIQEPETECSERKIRKHTETRHEIDLWNQLTNFRSRFESASIQFPISNFVSPH